MQTIFEKLAKCETAAEVERLLHGNFAAIHDTRTHVAVPREPTENMLYRGYTATGVSGEALLITELRQGYKAMLAAAEDTGHD